MARSFTGASTHHLSAASTPLTALPCSLAFWGKPSGTSQQAGLSIGKSSSNLDYVMLAVGDVNGGVKFQVRNSPATNAAETSAVTAGAWTHFGGRATSGGDIKAFKNGTVATATFSGTVMPVGLDAISIGRLTRLTPAIYWTGEIAAPAIWNVDLTDGEMDALAKGFSPLLIRPGNLIAYWPVIGRASPEIDRARSLNLTVTGAVVAPHPRIIMPRPSALILPFPSAGAAVTGSGELVCAGAEISGIGESGSDGAGALALQGATISGVGESGSLGSGILLAGLAVISGQGTVGSSAKPIAKIVITATASGAKITASARTAKITVSAND